MKNKGVLFTMMAFLIILSLLAMNNVIETKSENKSPENAIAFIRADNKFRNIKANIIDLQSDATLKYLNETILPFNYYYAADRKSLLMIQELPSNRGTLNNFFDVINIYALISQNRDYGKGIYNGLDVNIETAGNGIWGSNDSNRLQFLIKPFCLGFYSKDVNEIGFFDSNSGKCAKGFVIDDLAGYDLNAIIKQAVEDYNNVSCNFGGSSDCGNMGGSPGDPYFELNIKDSGCIYCQIPESLKTISGNYNPEASNSITISCQGAGCTSEPIYITFGKGLSVKHDGESIEARAEAKFESSIREFIFSDFNVTVVDADFNIVKTNKPNYLN